MKKITLFLMLFQIISSNAQLNKGIYGSPNWFKNWTNFKPKTSEYRQVTTILQGVIANDKVLTKNETYLLAGNVYLTNGAILFIEPGTVVRGDFETNGCLIITKGAKILAIGEETNPIVFTSNKGDSERKAGDWGGIVIMGDAPINKFSGQLPFNFDVSYNIYGGTNPESYSGILKYVRIEFAGKKGKNPKNLNGLSLAGVGKKTILECVQVSFSGDDSFEFYGGVIDTKNLISFKALDDDFDFTEGVQCKINNSIAMRNSFISSPDGSRAIEIDSYDVASNVDLNKKTTRVDADYLTIINDNNTANGISSEAIYLKEKTMFKIKNSVVSGFKKGVVLGSLIKGNYESMSSFLFENILFNHCDTNFTSENNQYASFVENWFINGNYLIQNDFLEDSKLFMEVDLKKTPDFRLIPTPAIAEKLAKQP
ncbi:MAG: hypothetical protein V4670_06750 [Bacteroidota bacterium]